MIADDRVENFVIEEVEKIVKERWRFIERTTRYGWLIASSKRRTISREDAARLSILANKIGYENCRLSLLRIRSACRDLHPHRVPEMAISILDEMYTLSIIRKCGRDSKWRNISLRDSPPTVYTISRALL